MSAICGLVRPEPLTSEDSADLARMLEPLQARGPDSEDQKRISTQSPPLGVILAARGLQISPKDPPAAVAVSDATGSLAVCDGRVFNTDEVIRYLEGRGRTPRTRQAAELLLLLYEVDGPQGLRRADAQFALAIWNATKNAMILARDPLGVRSLYYYREARRFLFASEAKALVAVPTVPAAFDQVAVAHYLTFLTVPGPRTLFDGVNKVPAGSIVERSADGRVVTSQYWDLLWDAIDERSDAQFYIDGTRERHQAAVARRYSEGPLAALVSGGNDSSANAVLIAKQLQPGQTLHTFTVGLKEVEGGEKYNDLVYAKQVADLIKSTHHEDLMTTDQFLETIPVTVDAMDDMVSEPSSVFLYHALKLAKSVGSKVVITGEANDELTCGHGEMIRIRERYYQRWQKMMQLPGLVRQLAAKAAPFVSPGRADLLNRAAQGGEYFWNFEIAWPEFQLDQILSPSARQATMADSPAAFVERDAARLRASAHGNRDYLNHIVYRMMQDYYFGNLMLGKLDLLSSRLGLEARCPYTDANYAHFVYNVPAPFKQKDGMVKWFFKKAIEGVLPDSIIYRPKQGFRTPVVELFKGPLGDWGRPHLLDGGLTKIGFLQRSEISRLLSAHRTGEADYSNKLWTVLVLNLWHDRWVAGRRTSRSVSTAAASSLHAPSLA